MEDREALEAAGSRAEQIALRPQLPPARRLRLAAPVKAAKGAK